MKKIVYYLLLAQAPFCAMTQELSFTTGYRHEDFRWSIAGNSSGRNPNIYSELKWQSLRGAEANMSLRWKIWKWVSVHAEGHYMPVAGGRVSDIDYSADNRQQPVYQGRFEDDRGAVAGWTLALGASLISRGAFRLSSWIGYGISYQDLYVLDHSGTFTDLNSRYTARWKGPAARLDGCWQADRRWRLYAGLDYSQVVYRAWADWNLISSFSHPVSFRHHANGYGIGTNAGIGYVITSRLQCRMGGSWYHWETGVGTDELYLAAGGSETTQMNGAFRNGFAVSAGLVISCSR